MQHDTLSKTDRVSNRNSSAFFVKLQTSWFRSLNINITNEPKYSQRWSVNDFNCHNHSFLLHWIRLIVIRLILFSTLRNRPFHLKRLSVSSYKTFNLYFKLSFARDLRVFLYSIIREICFRPFTDDFSPA